MRSREGIGLDGEGGWMEKMMKDTNWDVFALDSFFFFFGIHTLV